MISSYTPVTLAPSVAEALRMGDWSIAITGASGWMGQALLEALEPVFEEYDARVAAFGSTTREMTLRSGRTIQLRATEDISALTPANWILVHAAYATKDRISTQGNDAYISGNEQLTEAVTRAIHDLKPKAILFPSSGAVYGPDGELSMNIDANPYGVLKHRDEQHFSALAGQLGARIVIPRVFNMGGPYINKWSAYALSDLIVQLLDGKPLTVQSPGPVLRSYVFVGDILSLSLAILIDSASESPLTFDTRGDEDVEMADLARRIESALLPEPRSLLRTADPSAKGSTYLGKPEPMRALLARYGQQLMPLDQQIRLTAQDIGLRRTATK